MLTNAVSDIKRVPRWEVAEWEWSGQRLPGRGHSPHKDSEGSDPRRFQNSWEAPWLGWRMEVGRRWEEG